MSRREKESLFILKREQRIRKSRESFWEFCKTLTPTFYDEEKTYLKELCETLQAIYEDRLLNEKGEPYQRVLLSIPPRHGKTLTKDHFLLWVLGKEPLKTKIISASYSAKLSIISSRFVRNMITRTKNEPFDIDYSDIFPETRISKDNASVQEWALEGSFFTYKATSLNGSVTGMGTNLAVIDDIVKDHTIAFNEDALEKCYSWFTDTFLSRKEGKTKMIVIGTRWASNDIIGRLLNSPDAHKWKEIKIKAFDDIEKKMLCEKVLSMEDYEELKRNMDRNIFLANYQQEPFDMEGRLYRNLLYYDELPKEFEKIISYTDTADTGKDYLTSIIAGVKDKELYVLDVFYSNAPMIETEPKLAAFFDSNQRKWGIPITASFEGNAGGSQYARTIERLLKENHNQNKVIISYFHQSKNKESRILSNASFVQKHLFFERNINNRHSEFFSHLIAFQAEFKANKHDDCADALTGLVEMMDAIPTLKIGKKGW